MKRGVYLAGAWPQLTAAEHKKFHAMTMKVYRYLLPNASSLQYGIWLTDIEVLVMLGVMTPCMMLRYLRLSMFCRIIQYKPPAVLLLLCAAACHPSSWISAVKADFAFMVENFEVFENCKGTTWAQKVSTVSDNPKAFRGKLKKVALDPNAYKLESWPKSKAMQALETPHQCKKCSFVASDSQRFAAHICLHTW